MSAADACEEVEHEELDGDVGSGGPEGGVPPDGGGVRRREELSLAAGFLVPPGGGGLASASEPFLLRGDACVEMLFGTRGAEGTCLTVLRVVVETHEAALVRR